MSRVELGLLGATSFREPFVPGGPLGETWISRAAVQMVPVPVIGASWLRAEGRVVAFGLLDLRLMVLAELVLAPVPEVEELVLV